MVIFTLKLLKSNIFLNNLGIKQVIPRYFLNLLGGFHSIFSSLMPGIKAVVVFVLGDGSVILNLTNVRILSVFKCKPLAPTVVPDQLQPVA